MKRFFLLVVVLTAVTASWAGEMKKQTVRTQTVGDINIRHDDSNGWNIKATLSGNEEQEAVRLDFTVSSPQVPCRTEVEFTIPQKDIYQMFWSGDDGTHLRPNWTAYYDSQLACNMPVYTLMNNNDTNKLTVAIDEVKRYAEFNLGLREEGADIYCCVTLFEQPEAPIGEYSVTLYLDKRECFWADAVREMSEKITQSAGIKPCRVPDDAFAPLYSSWYQFHQNVSDSEIEAECREAKALGMKTIIVDDGWQTDDNNRGYAFCGDWEVSKTRFPDFAGHIKKVHEIGMKYMLWYSVPWMGAKSKNYARFEGKYLYFDHGQQAAALDPRFPEVREYLVDTYLRAMREWGLDGFKLDFIDSFHFRGEDPAVKENYAGRDIKSLPEAVDVLMAQVYDALHKENPDVLVEFRQGYIGPAIRQYGNMMRAGDCPGTPHVNRTRIAKLRLTSGQSAVHADMLEWNIDEKPENVATNIMNAMFGVVQYSAMLRDIPASQKAVVKHFIEFNREHENTLLHSEFRPHHPELYFPLIEACSADERIIGVYAEGMVVEVNTDRTTYVMNATGADTLTVRFNGKPRSVVVTDCYGNLIGKVKVKKGLTEVAVPSGGSLEIER